MASKTLLIAGALCGLLLMTSCSKTPSKADSAVTTLESSVLTVDKALSYCKDNYKGEYEFSDVLSEQSIAVKSVSIPNFKFTIKSELLSSGEIQITDSFSYDCFVNAKNDVESNSSVEFNTLRVLLIYKISNVSDIEPALSYIESFSNRMKYYAGADSDKLVYSLIVQDVQPNNNIDEIIMLSSTDIQSSNFTDLKNQVYENFQFREKVYFSTDDSEGNRIFADQIAKKSQYYNDNKLEYKITIRPKSSNDSHEFDLEYTHENIPPIDANDILSEINSNHDTFLKKNRIN